MFRVLGMDDVGCFVKWRGLGYEYVSTEPLTRVTEIDLLQEAIDRFSKLAAEINGASWKKHDKAKVLARSVTTTALLMGHPHDTVDGADGVTGLSGASGRDEHGQAGTAPVPAGGRQLAA